MPTTHFVMNGGPRCARAPGRVPLRQRGGKSRDIPVRHDLEGFLLQFIQAAGLEDGPLFRTVNRRTKTLTGGSMTGIDVLPDDEAPPKRSGPARPLLAALVPCGDGDGSSLAESPAGGRAAPRRARRPADHADLRPTAVHGDPEHRRADLDLSGPPRLPLNLYHQALPQCHSCREPTRAGRHPGSSDGQSPARSAGGSLGGPARTAPVTISMANPSGPYQGEANGYIR